MPYEIFMPDNEYGIEEGYYDWEGLINLIRKYKNEPETVQFIADMME